MFKELLSRLGNALDRHAIPYMISHKIFAGRPRDLEDVEGIILKNPDIGRAYIRKWLEQFDLLSEDPGGKRHTTIFEEILEQ